MKVGPRVSRGGLAAASLLLRVPGLVAAPQGTRTDYARAEQLLGWNAQELVLNDGVRARWMIGGRLVSGES